MTNLWQSNYEKTGTVTPQEFIQEQCNALIDTTNGKVIARISNYDGPIYSFQTNIFAAMQTIASVGIESFDIQDNLGDIGENTCFTYEVYLTSKITPLYKHRIFFIQYNSLIYPAKIVLQKDIANEIESKTTIDCVDLKSLEAVLEKIFKSAKVTAVIRNLLTLNID